MRYGFSGEECVKNVLGIVFSIWVIWSVSHIPIIGTFIGDFFNPTPVLTYHGGKIGDADVTSMSYRQ
jgi:hypothetical protein